MKGQTKLAKLCAQYMEEAGHDWSGNTKRYYGDELRRLVTYVGSRELTPLILSEFQKEQHARGRKASTVAQTLKAVKQFLCWAELMEIFRPTRFSSVIQLPTVARQKAETFSQLQYERLKEASKGTFWYYAIIVAYRTGARYSDCALLKWENVDLEKCYVRYTPFKTRKSGRQAVCTFDSGGDLHQVLIEMDAAGRHDHPMWAPYVCPEMAMYYPQDHAVDKGGNAGSGRRRQFEVLCKQCGIRGLSFHNLRHSFISRLVNSGTSYPMASQITGIAKEEVLRSYAEPDVDAIRKAIDKMDKRDEPPADGTVIKLPGAA